MKKSAFSYLELIISMSLVVMVVILTTPFLTHMAKKSVNPFGEFRCYAKFIDNVWKLCQKERINSDSFPEGEVCGDFCTFAKPVGVDKPFSIVVRAGGGGGSMPYVYVDDENHNLHVAPGAAGKDGEMTSATDTLADKFVDGVLEIKLCDDSAISTGYGVPEKGVICIGKGGEAGQNYSTENQEKLYDVKLAFRDDTVSDYHVNVLNEIGLSYAADALKTYIDSKTDENKSRVTDQLSLSSLAASRDNNTTYTGGRGMISQFKFSGAPTIVLNGGLGGKSSGNIVQPLVAPDNCQTSSGDNICIIKDSDSISHCTVTGNSLINCETPEKNNESKIDFGKGGYGGVAVCKYKDTPSSDTIDSLNGEYGCIKKSGGHGSGGSIEITWD